MKNYSFMEIYNSFSIKFSSLKTPFELPLNFNPIQLRQLQEYLSFNYPNQKPFQSLSFDIESIINSLKVNGEGYIPFSRF